MANPYNKPDEDLLNTFHRESPDFDLMNSINEELHNIAAAPCRIYKLDHDQSVKDPDDIYPELVYRTYLPPVIVKMYFITPTWTEELSRLGINMPEEVVFSMNLQHLIKNTRDAKAASSSSTAELTVTYTYGGATGQEPDRVYLFCDGEKLYSHWLVDGVITPDPGFELSVMDTAGEIDLNHAAVTTIEKLATYINGLSNYSASFTSDGDVLSIKTEIFAGDITNYADWYNLKTTNLTMLVDRTGGVYDNVADVLESGDIIETFRRHEATRDATEAPRGLDGSPIHDPVTKAEVRGKLYEVRYAFVANETPSRHYINYNVTADKVAMDVLETLLDKLPADEAWTVGGDRWYA